MNPNFVFETKQTEIKGFETFRSVVADAAGGERLGNRVEWG